MPHCTPPAVYSKKQKRCVVPEKRPDTVVCVHPKVYSQKQRRCVTPEPRVVQCRLPEVYSFKLGRCYVPTPRVVICAPPAVFSARLGRCIVPEPQVVVCRPPTIYSPKLGRCYVPEPKQASCNFPYVASGPTCVCASGYVSSAGRCVRRSTTSSVVIDVGRIQECLTRLGYDPGSIDGVQGRATRNAFREFQMANGMAARPASLSDAQTQGLLYEQCAAPPIEEASPDAPPPTELASPATLPQRCLPQDLYDLMKSAYGKDPALPACTPQTGYCLPKPLFYSEAKLAVVSASAGIRWCDQCITLNTWLPLETIFKIESAANVTLCAAPPALCYLPARPVVQTQTEIRTIYKALPISVGNEGDIAVVIGNETYANGMTPNVYGHADADAVVELLTEQLGYKKDNIIDLRDARLADFERVFGTAENPEGELASRISRDHPGDVIVYVSSHGMATGEGVGYLLPVDAKADELDKTAYPLQELYRNLGKAGARTVMLMLEATFATTVTDAVDAPNIPELEVLAMPETAIPGLAVFTAADRDQHTLEDPEYGIGLFTRYLLAGLAGEADVAPIGNGDKRIDTVELYVYAADMVRTAARKSFGLEQKPLLSKIDNLVVGKLASAE